MKPCHLAIPLSLLAAAPLLGQPAPSLTPGSPQPASSKSFSLLERSANTRLWERTEYEPAPDGQFRPKVHRVIELGSSICYQLPNGDWADTDDSFDITPQGYAVAPRGPAKIIIAPNLNTPEGVLDIQSPDGQRFRSGPVGLVVYSPATGKSLQVGRVQDCEAWQTAKNEITFFDAFEGLKANVRFRNELGGRFHQEVVLTRKLTPTTLARLGFSGDLTREPLWIEIWSEFIECPEAAVETTVLRSEADPVRRAAMVDPDTTDAFLDFGATKLARGIAFSEAAPTQSVTVFKRWLEDPETGHRFLVEACDYAELLPLLEPLEEATFASVEPSTPPKTMLAQNAPPSAAPSVTTSQGTERTSPSAASSGSPLRLLVRHRL
ncbi:MAG TPA: hypothetical protein VJA21_30685, partial [Verrucomicrobiae bacterium]